MRSVVTSRGASEPADVACVIAAKPAGVSVGPSATSIGSAADDCPPTTPGAVASAVHAARSLSVFEGVFLGCWELRMDHSAFHVWDGVPL